MQPWDKKKTVKSHLNCANIELEACIVELKDLMLLNSIVSSTINISVVVEALYKDENLIDCLVLIQFTVNHCTVYIRYQSHQPFTEGSVWLCQNWINKSESLTG